jgi:translation initiation factor 5
MADMRHKLSTYIVKNPPAQASKNQRKQRKAATAQTNDLGGGFEDDEGSDDDIISQRINKEAAGLTMQSQLAQEDWSEDTSAAAVAQRLKELAVKGVGAFGDDDDDENKYDLFGAWLEEQVNNTNDSNAVTDESIITKAQELGVYGKYKACQVLVQCIFDESIATQIPKRTKLLRKFVTEEKHQKAVLGGVERLVGLEYKDSLMKKVPAILMKLYDADVIDDEVFIKWGEKPTKKYVAKDVSKEVKKAAKPFLEWIATASEEESDEESD